MKSYSRSTADYFTTLPADRREALLAIRSLIKRTWAGIEENMDMGMPTYHLNGHALWAIGNQKNFMALYVVPHDLLHGFKKDLLIYDTGRSCIRFKRIDTATLDLFDRIIKYTGNQMEESDLLGLSKRKRGSRVLTTPTH
jgi:uncharacterized protein YdhG (YjbR/CyaY superfamily)